MPTISWIRMKKKKLPSFVVSDTSYILVCLCVCVYLVNINTNVIHPTLDSEHDFFYEHEMNKWYPRNATMNFTSVSTWNHWIFFSSVNHFAPCSFAKWFFLGKWQNVRILWWRNSHTGRNLRAWLTRKTSRRQFTTKLISLRLGYFVEYFFFELRNRGAWIAK